MREETGENDLTLWAQKRQETQLESPACTYEIQIQSIH